MFGVIPVSRLVALRSSRFFHVAAADLFASITLVEREAWYQKLAGGLHRPDSRYFAGEAKAP